MVPGTDSGDYTGHPKALVPLGINQWALVNLSASALNPVVEGNPIAYITNWDDPPTQAEVEATSPDYSAITRDLAGS